MSISLAEAIEEAKLRIDCAQVEWRRATEGAPTLTTSEARDAVRAETEILCLRIFIQVAESILRRAS